MTKSDYNLNVFINCPLDDKYKQLMYALIFTVYDCGFIPRCALEINDCGIVRHDKIEQLVDECKYGIHDISRTELDGKHRLPRFNMPYELGLFRGAKRYGGVKHKKKSCLILDRVRHRYQKFISDIAGQDIQDHNNKIQKIITCVRNWLRATSKKNTIPGGSEITKKYKSFKKDLPKMCKNARIKVSELTFNDYSQFVSEWLRQKAEGSK